MMHGPTHIKILISTNLSQYYYTVGSIF